MAEVSEARMNEYDHELKTIQPYFEMVWNDKKPYEVRVNDRSFQAGDTILLREYDAGKKVYSGRGVIVNILSVISLPGLLAMYDQVIYSELVILGLVLLGRVNADDRP